jgi:N-formylglutamate amidohydrolase
MTFRKTSASSLVLPLAIAWLAPTSLTYAQADVEIGKLVATQEGQLPIILSAPHGGTADVPNTPPRQGVGLVKGAKGFFTGRDPGTEELCYEVSAAIESRLKQKPYYVVAKFHRRYIDPNRPAEIGYEDPDAKPVYDAFHDALKNFCRDVQHKHHCGLLLDIHGQGSARGTVFRGTQNGKTVTLLKQRFGDAAHLGPNSLFGTLGASGWTVHPQGDGPEQSGFTGGYIVQTYGSHQGYGIDAIQLEFGADYRSAENRKKTAATLADAVEAFWNRYLSKSAADNPLTPSAGNPRSQAPPGNAVPRGSAS